MSTRVVSRVVVVSWLMLAFAGAGDAGQLYRWVTQDGRVEIGPVPPSGVHAEPWQPVQPAPAVVTPPPTPAAAETPAPAPAPAASQNAAPSGTAPVQQASTGDCSFARERALDVMQRKQETETEIKELEATIARLEDSMVVSANSTCRTDDYGAQRNSRCTGDSFDRDKELSRSRKKLEKAKDRLDELEDRERTTQVSDCPPPASPYGR